MEVVNRTGRRATEWEIALVQVVAARIAGFLEDESYTDSGGSPLDCVGLILGLTLRLRSEPETQAGRTPLG